MKIKTDWPNYLHSLRRREIEMIFGACPPKIFARGLELGAGDGFQSQLLSHFVTSLVVTDYAEGILAQPDGPGLTHRVCDAEQVGEVFEAGEFDLVFSSNMLEHLPDPQQALAGMHRVLADQGIAIHVVPSPFWKLTQMAGFYPNLVITRLERYSERMRGDPLRSTAAVEGWDNNPKIDGRRYSRLRRLLWPVPHGISASNWREIFAFRAGAWRGQFAAAGFEVVAMLRGPVVSGYGFGLERLRSLLERAGLASETVYVTVKTGQASPFLPCFR